MSCVIADFANDGLLPFGSVVNEAARESVRSTATAFPQRDFDRDRAMLSVRVVAYASLCPAPGDAFRQQSGTGVNQDLVQLRRDSGV